MNSNVISGSLVYKGETGLSAYEIAVQNGYQGTEQDWLATLGTSSHFTKTSTVYETTEDNQTEFDLPTGYTSSSFIDVYVAGVKEKDEDVTIDTEEETITLSNAVATTGTEVEVVMTTMSTNNLPISNTINSDSTNDTASGTKSVYDYVEGRGFVDISNVKRSRSLNAFDYFTAEESTHEQTIEVDLPNDMYVLLGVTYLTAWAIPATTSQTIIDGCICTGYYDRGNKMYVNVRMLNTPTHQNIKITVGLAVTYISNSSS